MERNLYTHRLGELEVERCATRLRLIRKEAVKLVVKCYVLFFAYYGKIRNDNLHILPKCTTLTEG